MLLIPSRSAFRGFGSREQFEDEAKQALARFQQMYREAPTSREPPDWAKALPGIRTFNVHLPAPIVAGVMRDEAIGSALASLFRHMSERGRTVLAMARVENAAGWYCYVDTQWHA